MLKWLLMQSRATGTNIFKIPIRVVVNKVTKNRHYEKWKRSINRELESLLNSSQIIYCEGHPQVDGQL